MSDEIVGTSTCRWCGEVFAGPSRAFVIGAPEQRLIEHLQRLAEHVRTKHQRLDQINDLYAKNYLGFLRLLCYDTTDSEVLKQIDLTRWWLNQFTTKNRISDETIAARAKEIGAQLIDDVAVGLADGYDRDAYVRTAAIRIERIITDLRELLQEHNRYQVAVSAPVDPEKVPA